MQRLKLTISSLLLICTMQYGNSTPNNAEITATKVLAKLFQSAGQLNVELPTLKMANENRRVAAYFPKNNTIVLDHKAFDICKGMGKDSLSALAFILGHELAHAFQKEVKTKSGTNFLTYDQTYKVDTRTEKVADIHGVFTAFLAGYRLKAVVPKLLPLLYDAYGLTNKTLQGYPSLEERSRSAQEVLDITDDLIDLYETGNYLLTAGYYDLAATNYAYILQYYQGREIHNNLGVLYLFQAMEYYQPQTDRFVFPVEMDAATQLQKIEKSRGPQDLPLQDKMARMQLLNKATAHFMQAIALDANYLTAKLNYVCALGLLQKPKDAQSYFNKNKLLKTAAKDAAMTAKLKLAQGILSALMNDKLGATASFHEVTKSTVQTAAVTAQYNLAVLQNTPVLFLPEHEFEFPDSFKAILKGIKMGKTSQVEPLVLNDSGDFIKHLSESSTETFTFGKKGANLVSIVRFKNSMAGEIDLLNLTEQLEKSFFYNLVSTPNGFFLKSDTEGIMVKVSNDGKVQEIAKLIKH